MPNRFKFIDEYEGWGNNIPTTEANAVPLLLDEIKVGHGWIHNHHNYQIVIYSDSFEKLKGYNYTVEQALNPNREGFCLKLQRERRK